jgi:hypothetical protein
MRAQSLALRPPVLLKRKERVLSVALGATVIWRRFNSESVRSELANHRGVSLFMTNGVEEKLAGLIHRRSAIGCTIAYLERRIPCSLEVPMRQMSAMRM